MTATPNSQRNPKGPLTHHLCKAGPGRYRWLLIAVLIISTCCPLQRLVAATAYIYNTWWSSAVDNDRDGYFSSATLNIDVDVLGGGSLLVYEKIYVRLTFASSWVLLMTTSQHLIYSDSALDATSVVIYGYGGRAFWDYRVEVYRAGYSSYDHYLDPSRDTDLGAHPEESFQDDTALYATIYNAWWTDSLDIDQDGCVSGARLNWDVDVVGGGSLSVYEKIYYRPDGSTYWIPFLTTSPHTITGSLTTDSSSTVVLGSGSCALYDYRIEVYRNGFSSYDHALDPATDPDLNNHREETLPLDSIAFIYNVWWDDLSDPDRDGCISAARLHIDTDVLGTEDPMVVFEKIYYRPAGASGWILHSSTSPHIVSGLVPDDTVSIVLSGVGTCGFYDCRIEVYQVGRTRFDDAIGPADDADLASLKFEAPDVTKPTVSVVRPAA